MLTFQSQTTALFKLILQIFIGFKRPISKLDFDAKYGQLSYETLLLKDAGHMTNDTLTFSGLV